MVTPFGPDGAVDFDVAAKLAKFLVDQGSDGLVVAGSTGEGTSLSDDEKLGLFACVAEASRARARGFDVLQHRQLGGADGRVAKTGVAGVLATTPAYARPSQSGIAAHLGAVADSTRAARDALRHPVAHRAQDASSTTVGLVRSHRTSSR